MDEAGKQTSRSLDRIRAGDREAAEELFPLVYDQLHALAQRFLRSERADHTLQPTALVHEAYLRVARPDDDAWNGRAHFTRTAARAMRQILVDYARRRSAARRGGGVDRQRITLSDVTGGDKTSSDLDVLELEEALTELERMNPRLCRVAELRLFGGLSAPEIGQALELGASTVEGDWTLAKACLARSLRTAD